MMLQQIMKKNAKEKKTCRWNMKKKGELQTGVGAGKATEVNTSQRNL